MRRNRDLRTEELKFGRNLGLFCGLCLVLMAASGLLQGEFSLDKAGSPYTIFGESVRSNFSREDPAMYYFTISFFLILGLIILYLSVHCQYILMQRRRRRRQSMMQRSGRVESKE